MKSNWAINIYEDTPTSLPIRKMQINPIMSYTTYLRRVKLKDLKTGGDEKDENVQDFPLPIAVLCILYRGPAQGIFRATN